jgi:hypothetical protein
MQRTLHSSGVLLLGPYTYSLGINPSMFELAQTQGHVTL